MAGFPSAFSVVIVSVVVLAISSVVVAVVVVLTAGGSGDDYSVVGSIVAVPLFEGFFSW